MADTEEKHRMVRELYEQALVYENEAERLKTEAAAFREQTDAMIQAMPASKLRSTHQRQRVARQSGHGTTPARPKKKRTRRESKRNVIDTIPQEIFDLILDELYDLRGYHSQDTKELLPLRLVSHRIHDMVADRFAMEHFTDVEFTVSDEQDVQTAIALASHPVYGKAIKNVTLRFDEMETQEAAIEYFNKPAKYPPGHELTMHEIDRASAIDKFGPETEAISQRWMVAKTHELDFISSARISQALRDLFSALKEMGKLQVLKIRSDHSGLGDRDTRGRKLLYKQIYGQSPRGRIGGSDNLLYRYPVAERQMMYFGTTLEALVAAGLEVPIFDIWSDNIRIELLAKDIGMVQLFCQALRNTHEFHCNVSKTYEGTSYNALPKMDFYPILHLIVSMPQLTTLHLRGIHSPGTTLFMDALLRQQLPHLKELFLDEMFIFWDMLEDFVERHPKLDLLATIKCRFYTESSGRARPELLLKNSFDYVKDYKAENIGRLKRDKVCERWDYDRTWADFTVDGISPAHLPRDSSGYWF